MKNEIITVTQITVNAVFSTIQPTPPYGNISTKYQSQSFITPTSKGLIRL